MSYEYQIGDILTRPKGPATHYGLYVENGVLHNTPQGGTHVVSLDVFADGRPVSVQRGSGNIPAVLQRARRELQEKRPYNLFTHNCEHLAKGVAHGKKESGQVVVGIILAIAAVSLGYWVLQRR